MAKYMLVAYVTAENREQADKLLAERLRDGGVNVEIQNSCDCDPDHIFQAVICNHTVEWLLETQKMEVTPENVAAVRAKLRKLEEFMEKEGLEIVFEAVEELKAEREASAS